MNAKFANLSIAVLGAGESGRAVARLLRFANAKVAVLDSGPKESLASVQNELHSEGIPVCSGDDALGAARSKEFDLAVISPGIDPKVSLVEAIQKRGIPITGELEVAYGFCECPIIGITGTNGKTTTTQLVETMLNHCGIKTVAAGNIGPAFSAKVCESQGLDVMTLEISSFQLETIEKFHCRVAVWLGFAPDHLDRYASMDAYYQAKVRIFETQTEDDWAIVNVRDQLPPLKARRLTFSAFQPGGDFDLLGGVIRFRGKDVFSLSETKLRGSHNAENLMAALGVGHALGLSFEAMRKPLCDYRPMPHRCEFVRTIDGVDWINDSKGTNPDAVEKALIGETRPVVLICGGKDKGFEFDLLSEVVAKKCRCAIAMGEMAERIVRTWSGRIPVFDAGRSLEAAVQSARKHAQSGDVVLFSPGTSSFDMFKNYADRGDQFRTLVQTLTPNL